MKYQLQSPRAGLVLAIILALAAIILLPPTLVGYLLGDQASKPQPVVLSSVFASDYEAPLLIDGHPLTCPSYPDSPLMFGFTCATANIESIIHETPADPENMLRRMARAGSYGLVDKQAEIETFGDTLVLMDGSYGLVGFVTPIDDDRTLYAQIDMVVATRTNEQLVSSAWEAVHDEALPEELAHAVEQFSPHRNERGI